MAKQAPAEDLTLKQALFVAAYLGESKGNALDAARKAGYSQPIGSSGECMRNPKILARISSYVDKHFATADDVLEELTSVAMAEWKDFITIRTNPRTGETIEVKMDLGSKVKSLELLGKYHQLFSERVIHSGPDNGPIVVEQHNFDWDAYARVFAGVVGIESDSAGADGPQQLLDSPSTD